MLITISSVLDETSLLAARDMIPALSWRDGAETAGETARAVKQNEQADLSTRTGTALRAILNTAVENHPVLRAAAQPKRISSLIVSRTGAGGGYGRHIDNAFMGHGAARLRTDLSFTLFLSDPESYQGGELEIETAGFTQTVKLPAGDLVLYPTTTLHQVAKVTSGQRIVCLGWIESLVPDGADREILFDLENLKASLARKHPPQSEEMLVLSKTIANLLRKLSR
jgi:PKHD-type hydroxylase